VRRSFLRPPCRHTGSASLLVLYCASPISVLCPIPPATPVYIPFRHGTCPLPMLNPMAELSKSLHHHHLPFFFGPCQRHLTVSAGLNSLPHSICSVSSASFSSTTCGVNLRSFYPCASKTRSRCPSAFTGLRFSPHRHATNCGEPRGADMTGFPRPAQRTRNYVQNFSADAAPRCGVFFFLSINALTSPCFPSI